MGYDSSLNEAVGFDRCHHLFRQARLVRDRQCRRFLAVTKHDVAEPVSQLKLVDGKLGLPSATRDALKRTRVMSIRSPRH